MKGFFDAYGRFVARRPELALATVFALTVLAIIGFTLTADQADENEAFLPDNSDLIAASENLARSFPQSSALEAVQVVLRGDVLTPGGAADAFMATQAAATDAGLAPFIAQGRPATSPGHLLRAMLAGPGGDPASVDLASTPQAGIDAALADEDETDGSGDPRRRHPR